MKNFYDNYDNNVIGLVELIIQKQPGKNHIE